jgi:hypothetical protein
MTELFSGSMPTMSQSSQWSAQTSASFYYCNNMFRFQRIFDNVPIEHCCLAMVLAKELFTHLYHLAGAIIERYNRAILLSGSNIRALWISSLPSAPSHRTYNNSSQAVSAYASESMIAVV